MVSSSFPPFTLGGAEIYERNLGLGLKERGHDVVVMAGEKGSLKGWKTVTLPKNKESRYAKDYVERKKSPWYVTSKSVLKSLADPKYYLRLTRAIKDVSPDILHMHNTHNYTLTNALVKASGFLNIPLVWTVHDYWFMCPINTLLPPGENCRVCGGEENCARICLRELERGNIKVFRSVRRLIRGLRKVDQIIAPSDFTASLLESRGFEPHGIRTVPNGVPDPYKGRVEKKTDKLRLLFIGSGHHKGLHVLEQAIRSLDQRVEVNVVSSRPPETENNGVDVIWRQRPQDKELKELYERCHALVIPSVWAENNPLVALEAMMASCALIGTDMGGIKEIVTNDTSVTFPCGDSKALAKIISDFGQDIEGVVEMGAKARQRAESNYMMEDNVSKVEEIYREVLDS